VLTNIIELSYYGGNDVLFYLDVIGWMCIPSEEDKKRQIRIYSY